LVSAEVQTIKDGGLNLHTRSLKYGKLKNGTMVVVPSVLIKRSKSHFLNIGQVDVILGMNGYLWVSKHAPQNQNTEDLYSDQNLPFSIEEREEISKVCNVLRVLGSEGVMIDESMIVYMIEAAAEMSSFDILSNKDDLIQYALEKLGESI
jgi:exosome complex component RRP4